ncbi:MAG: DUF4474 domain-containing protein [Eubacterium sp.]|nr:DUF4474 domain-containing protein [Eubacterium sp.]
MDKHQKCSKIEELTAPFGYNYHCRCGFFSSALDARQKSAGYTWLYDYKASRFRMVFDALPIYFNYRGRTWLIELWKGQYGISTGAELGIYHANKILSESEYKTAFFTAAKDSEMLPCTLRLCDRKEIDCVQISERHWWLTLFVPGCFSEPSMLSLEISICFPDTQMCDAFYDGLCAAGYTTKDIMIQGRCLTFMFHAHKDHFDLLTRFHRRLSQCLNRIFCRLYIWITQPFLCTEDRILFLYYYLPIAFRKLLRLRRFH